MFIQKKVILKKKSNGKFVTEQVEVTPAVPEHYTDGNTYFRSTNLYVNFNQLSLNLESNLKNINRLFSKLIDKIGYVEPENMQLYRDNMNVFVPTLDQLFTAVIKTNGFDVLLKGSAKSADEKSNLKEVYDRLGQQSATLLDYDGQVKSTYNYKNKNMVLKRNPSSIGGDQSLPDYSKNDDE